MPSLNFNNITKAYKGTQQLDKIYHGNKQIFPYVTPVIPDPYLNNVVFYLKGEDLLDSSPSPKTITNNGNVTSSNVKSKYGGKSLLFNASNFLGVNIAISGEFTIEGWINPPNSLWAVFNNGMTMLHNQNKLRIENNFFNTSALVLNQWTHFAFVRNSSGLINCFLNGIKDSNTPSDNRNFTITKIGLDVPNYGSFNGYLDSYRISNIARYTANFNPETDTYLAY
jgi:hypothetical protein